MNIGIDNLKPKPTTLADVKAKDAAYLEQEARKCSAAADFLRANPAFDEFLCLIRSGALSLY